MFTELLVRAAVDAALKNYVDGIVGNPYKAGTVSHKAYNDAIKKLTDPGTTFKQAKESHKVS